MGVIDYIRRFFVRTPRYHTTSYKPVYKAVVSVLRRPGVRVGRGAGYPRVEIHSITEGERMDKEGAIRELTMTVESISSQSEDQCAAMNEENLTRLTYQELKLEDGWRCFGIIPEQLQDMVESSDTDKIIYRLLQTYRVYVERVKS